MEFKRNSNGKQSHWQKKNILTFQKKINLFKKKSLTILMISNQF